MQKSRRLKRRLFCALRVFYTDTLQNDAIRLVRKKMAEGNDRGWVPTYHFAICSHNEMKIRICELRADGDTEECNYRFDL